MIINSKFVNLLKEPFGILIKEDMVNKEILFPFISKSNKIVTVGDTTTEKLLKLGFIPNLSIIDNKEKRILKNKNIELDVDKKFYFSNRPGEINEEVMDLIKKITVMDFNRIQIIIDGEEDLLSLPLFIYSPDKWTIFYGQPNEGLVIVEINDIIREKAESIFNKVFSA
jgi:uncharacterized protein (UPF0218 family)